MAFNVCITQCWLLISWSYGICLVLVRDISGLLLMSHTSLKDMCTYQQGEVVTCHLIIREAWWSILGIFVPCMSRCTKALLNCSCQLLMWNSKYSWNAVSMYHPPNELAFINVSHNSLGSFLDQQLACICKKQILHKSKHLLENSYYK